MAIKEVSTDERPKCTYCGSRNTSFRCVGLPVILGRIPHNCQDRVISSSIDYTEEQFERYVFNSYDIMSKRHTDVVILCLDCNSAVRKW